MTEEHAADCRGHVRWWAYIQLGLGLLTWAVIGLGALALCHAARAQERATVPGAANEAVQQWNIGSTICRPDWERASRPPVSATEPIKRSLLRPGQSARDYELDHDIPLCLGGAPLDRKNLWLQRWPEAREKDRLEVKLCRMVCAGEIGLVEAQSCIARDWVACAKKIGVAP